MPDESEFQADVQVAHEAEARVKSALVEGRKSLWRLAEALYDFEEAHGWMRLGYESLSEWLADPEIGLTSGTYYRLARTWTKMVVHRGIEPEKLLPLDTAKVALIADAVAKAKVSAKEALSDAESLGWRDLREKYRPPSKPLQDEDGDDDLSPALGNGDSGELEVPSAGDEATSSPAEAATATAKTSTPPDWESDAKALLPLDEVREALASRASYPRLRRKGMEGIDEFARRHGL